VRGRIIGRQPLSSIGEAFSKVRREENWRNVMLGKKGQSMIVEGSTLAGGLGVEKKFSNQQQSNES
jgi:hypothetical protein